MIDDAIGLQRAYASENGEYVYGNTLYSSGSVAPTPYNIFSRPWAVARDWLGDDPRLFFGSGAIRSTAKYNDQLRVLRANPQIRRIVGHSLSARTSLQIDDDFKGKYDVTAYSTPIISPHIAILNDKADPRRIRGTFDPVAMFDGNASKTIPTTTFNTHSYAQLARGNMGKYYGDDIATKDGWLNPDGSQSLFR